MIVTEMGVPTSPAIGFAGIGLVNRPFKYPYNWPCGGSMPNRDMNSCNNGGVLLFVANVIRACRNS